MKNFSVFQKDLYCIPLLLVWFINHSYLVYNKCNWNKPVWGKNDFWYTCNTTGEKVFYQAGKYNTHTEKGHILIVHLDECSQNEDTHKTSPQIKTILYPSIMHPFSTLLQCNILDKSIFGICLFQFCNQFSTSTKKWAC